jgi:hypothetical protein
MKHFLFTFVHTGGADVPLYTNGPRNLTITRELGAPETGEELTQAEYDDIVTHFNDQPHPHDFLLEMLGHDGSYIEGEVVGYCVEGNTPLSQRVTEMNRWSVSAGEDLDVDSTLTHWWASEPEEPKEH